MQHGIDYFNAKWGSPIEGRFTDEWGNTTAKERAKGTAMKWKVNSATTVEVLAVGEVVQCIQYSGHAGPDLFWTDEQIGKALAANGHEWREPQLNPVAMLMRGAAPHTYVSAEGNEAFYGPTSRQLTIKSAARLQAEAAKRAVDEALRAQAERETRY